MQCMQARALVTDGRRASERNGGKIQPNFGRMPDRIGRVGERQFDVVVEAAGRETEGKFEFDRWEIYKIKRAARLTRGERR